LATQSIILSYFQGYVFSDGRFSLSGLISCDKAPPDFPACGAAAAADGENSPPLFGEFSLALSLNLYLNLYLLLI
jgi:hypothetical protein